MPKISFSLILLLLILWVMPTQAQVGDIFNQPWHAEYFNNPYLAGTPNITRFDSGIGFDWGFDAPASGLPVDNFSVRWGKGGTMPTGTYRFIVSSSLAFRLYLDNEVILDTWEGGSESVTVGQDVFIEAGFHNIQLDYRAFGGDAFIYLDWGLAPDGEVAPQSNTAINANTVTITANTLNVRSEARIANNIIARITRGQQFTQIDISEDDRWLQIDLGNGMTGWISASFVTFSNVIVTTEGLSGQTLRSSSRLLILSAPSDDAEAIGLLLQGEDAAIIGRSADGEWWQIDYNGVSAWVNATFVILSPDIDNDLIPISD